MTAPNDSDARVDQTQAAASSTVPAAEASGAGGRPTWRARASRVSLLGPLGAAVVGRLAQFAVLFAITRSFDGHTGSALVLAFGLFAAFGILADSGAGNYLLALPHGSLTRQVYGSAVRLQAVFAVIGCGAALAIALFSSGGLDSPVAVVVLAAVALSQTVDAMSRAVRSPLLGRSRDLAYAVPDLIQGMLKIAVAVVAVAAHLPIALVVLPLLNAVVIGQAGIRVRRLLPSGAPASRNTYVRIVEIGLSGAATALYSQAPLFVASLVLPLSSSSMIALVYRFTQPFEIVPSTLSQQAIPRLVRRPERVGRYWLGFVACAIVVVPMLLLVRPLIEGIFSVQFSPVFVFVIAAFALLPKFGNYALVAELLASGRARLRLVVACSIGVLSVVLALILSRQAGIGGVVVGALCSEVALAATLWTLLLRRRTKRVTA